MQHNPTHSAIERIPLYIDSRTKYQTASFGFGVTSKQATDSRHQFWIPCGTQRSRTRYAVGWSWAEMRATSYPVLSQGNRQVSTGDALFKSNDRFVLTGPSDILMVGTPTLSILVVFHQFCFIRSFVSLQYGLMSCTFPALTGALNNETFSLMVNILKIEFKSAPANSSKVIPILGD